MSETSAEVLGWVWALVALSGVVVTGWNLWDSVRQYGWMRQEGPVERALMYGDLGTGTCRFLSAASFLVIALVAIKLPNDVVTHHAVADIVGGIAVTVGSSVALVSALVKRFESRDIREAVEGGFVYDDDGADGGGHGGPGAGADGLRVLPRAGHGAA